MSEQDKSLLNHLLDEICTQKASMKIELEKMKIISETESFQQLTDNQKLHFNNYRECLLNHYLILKTLYSSILEEISDLQIDLNAKI